jgi:riboflavin kinase/FMN adenylyltransferase
VLDGSTVVSRHDGVTSFGIRPMWRTNDPLMETHFFDFDGDLYGKSIAVELVEYIRPEAKFTGLEALVAQIKLDANRAREILAR